MFVLGEIHVRGPKIVYGHVRVENFKANIPKDNPSVLEEGPKVGVKAAQDNPNHGGSRRPVGQSMPRW